tara:strand:+ start:2221 stop:3183 length:963 start_codon:yes stop_codon:yes gene_type:complete
VSYLKGFNTVFETTLNNELQDNLIEFFDWGLLEKGNYFNTTKGETSSGGQDYSKLSLSKSQSFSSGRAWESFRKNWVWQSGIEPSGMTAPIIGTDHAHPGVSGVYVDDTFYATSGEGTYAHYIDYFNGRVVFDNAIPTTSKVQVEHSYKYINVIYANSLPWLREIQYRSLDLGSSSSSDFTLPSELKVQLPAIAIEVVPRRTFRGYQLGGGQYVRTDVLFHCIAEDEMTRNKLVDIVSFQNDKVFKLFDNDTLAESGVFPLDYRGVPVSGALRYPDIVDNHDSGKDAMFTNSVVQGMELVNSRFYAGIVRSTLETINTNI